MAEEKEEEGVKEKILAFIDQHKDKLGEDYENIKEKVEEFKADVLSREDIKKISQWIKKHPFLSVGFAMFLGAAVNKMMSKGE